MTDLALVVTALLTGEHSSLCFIYLLSVKTQWGSCLVAAMQSVSQSERWDDVHWGYCYSTNWEHDCSKKASLPGIELLAAIIRGIDKQEISLKWKSWKVFWDFTVACFMTDFLSLNLILFIYTLRKCLPSKLIKLSYVMYSG